MPRKPIARTNQAEQAIDQHGNPRNQNKNQTAKTPTANSDKQTLEAKPDLKSTTGSPNSRRKRTETSESDEQRSIRSEAKGTEKRTHQKGTQKSLY